MTDHFHDSNQPSDHQFIDELLQTPAVCLALNRLFEANNSAVACGRDPWDFAIELSQLSELGVGTHILRMMICRMWITHMREIARDGGMTRKYEPESDLVLSNHSCFVLTKKGFDIAQKLSASRSQSMPNSDSDRPNPNGQNDQNSMHSFNGHSHPQSNGHQMQPAPCWDRERRELRMGDVLVKRFKWPAQNQEQVLDAFQEEGWPRRIDDPLVRSPEIDPKRRLHDTLKCLNRKQVNGIIKFRGDGTGQGVLLEINLDPTKDN